jgi:hypothetical protein
MLDFAERTVLHPKQAMCVGSDRIQWVGLLLASAMVLLSGCSTTPRVSLVDPKIVSIEEWGGMRVDMSASNARAHVPTRITLHHGGVAFLRERDPMQYLRNLQTWSRNTRGWADIPYHYLIDLDGRVYEGRNVLFAGDTNTEYDPKGHALIVVLGNFEEVEPNPAQLEAVVSTMAMLARRFNLSAEVIAGHKDFSAQTACPGKSLYPYLTNGFFKQEVAKRLQAR